MLKYFLTQHKGLNNMLLVCWGQKKPCIPRTGSETLIMATQISTQLSTCFAGFDAHVHIFLMNSAEERNAKILTFISTPYETEVVIDIHKWMLLCKSVVILFIVLCSEQKQSEKRYCLHSCVLTLTVENMDGMASLPPIIFELTPKHLCYVVKFGASKDKSQVEIHPPIWYVCLLSMTQDVFFVEINLSRELYCFRWRYFINMGASSKDIYYMNWKFADIDVTIVTHLSYRYKMLWQRTVN